MESNNKMNHSARTTKKYKPPEKRRKPVKRVGGRPGKEQSLWAVTVTIVSFALSISILFISTELFKKISPYWSFVVVLFIIMIGVMFDIVGVAVTAADEKPFHAMASKKYAGARQAIELIRNADKVASICNDVIGDICGVVSGTAGAAIIYRLFSGNAQTGWLEACIGGLIAAVTVGGKAFAKKFGMNNSQFILYQVGLVISVFMPNYGKR